MRIDRNSITKPHLLLFLAMVIALGHQAIFVQWTCDDAFISYRYAENLSHGQGLVFNSGEKVEGFSNFSWVVLLAFFNRFGLSPLWVAKVFSVLSSLLLIGLVFKTARASGVGSVGALLCSFLVGSATSLAYFSMSGLETVLYTYLLLLAVYLNKKFISAPLQRTLSILYAVLLCVAITRPEGILFLLISAVYHAGQGLPHKKREGLKTTLPVPLLFLSLYAGFILLRYVYYADIFPNTFYAKPLGTFVEAGYNAFFVNFSSGFISGSFFLFPLLLFMAHKKFLFQNLYPILFCLAQVFFMSYTGDWMAFGRFFFPVFPLAVVLTLTFLSSLRGSSSTQRHKHLVPFMAFAVWLVFAGLNGMQTIGAMADKDNYPYLVMNSAELTKAGKWLQDNFSPDTTISLRRQGAVPYYSQMRSLDFLGLTDKTIARMVFHKKDLTEESQAISRYIVQQGPDLIILFSSKSEVRGWSIDASPAGGRLNHLEYLIHELAIKEGYTALQSIPLGEIEEAHLLAKPRAPDLLR
jgi:arabinofuranosyltransferase